jgi:hypothetical protein
LRLSRETIISYQINELDNVSKGVDDSMTFVYSR